MESVFKTWKTSRKIYLKFLEQYTVAQLNTIPKGFSNNLIWNIGHVIVAQQALIYMNSELDGYISREMFDLYKPGTFPTGKTSEEEILQLKKLLLEMIEKTEVDFNNGEFKTFNARMTGTGFHLGSLRDAFEFNNYHEGLHLGFMYNIRKFV